MHYFELVFVVFVCNVTTIICKISSDIIDEIDATRLGEHLRYLSSTPHLAGSVQNDEFAQYIFDEWQLQGLDEVKYASYDVLLSFPHWDASLYNKVNIVNGDADDVVFAASGKESKLSQHEEPYSDAVPNYSAYSATGSFKGDLVYVNYGRMEDYEWLRNAGIDISGKIVIARNGKTWRGGIVFFAQKYGAKGVILYSDPKEFAQQGRQNVYPNSDQMPGEAAQKGTISNGYGDLLTPNYPATDGAYRIPMKALQSSTLLVQPIGYNDAEQLLKGLGGPTPPADWIGGLNASYNVGPGFADKKLKLVMEINNEQNITKITNVIGTIRGAVEPDRYVIVGSHRDAWAFGAVDSASATASMLEVSRVLGKSVKDGWRPWRTIIFASWDAEEFGMIGSTEWVEENLKVLQNRAIIYINSELATAGCDVVVASGYPLTARMLFDSAKKVPNPKMSERTRGLPTLYDQWKAHFPSTPFHFSSSNESLPNFSILRAGSDFSPFAYQAGISSVDNSYAKLEVAGSKIARYPLYHTLYDTYHNFEKFMDPGFNCTKAISQLWLEQIRVAASSAFLPFNARDYADYINFYRLEFVKTYGEKLKGNNITTEILEDAVENFKTSTENFHIERNAIDPSDSILKVRMSNDKLMQVDRAFLKPNAQYGQSATHVIFSQRSSAPFSSIADLITTARTQDDWRNVRKEISETTYYINSAAKVLKNNI